MNQHIPSRMPLSYLDHFILQKCPIYHTHTYTHTDREKERIDKKKYLKTINGMHAWLPEQSQPRTPTIFFQFLIITEEINSPSTSLVQSLSHKMTRKIIFKEFNILKRVMNICIRHGSTFKPAIKHLVKGKEGQHGKWGWQNAKQM